jgi:hypothetical protein
MIRLARVLAPILLVGAAGCATMTEARTETVASRVFRGTRVSRVPGADALRVTTRRDGAALVVSVAREEGCVVTSTEVKTIDAHVTQTPGGNGFLVEAACVAMAVPVAVLYLPAHDADPLGFGSGRGAGIVAAALGAVCAAGAAYDLARASSRDERRTEEVPVPPTTVPCGPARPAALAEIVVRGRDGTELRATADSRGEATFASAPGGEVVVALEGLSARAPLDEARLTVSSGTLPRAERKLAS